MNGLTQVRWRTAAGRGWRLVLLVAVLAVATVYLYVVGVAGQRLGWLTAPLVLSGAGGALAWLLLLRHPRRTVVIATVAVVGVAAGIVVVLTLIVFHLTVGWRTRRLAGAPHSRCQEGMTGLAWPDEAPVHLNGARLVAVR